MRRALLLLNPEATSVSPAVHDVIARALASELKLDVAETKRRHHATHLAQGAAHEGFDIVVCFGGDGTLNEVINGLAGTDVPLIPLPGGGTNVFARTMGLPKDPIEATTVVLRHLQEGTPARRINLGALNGRAFAFCAGIGLDAAVVRAVERRFRLKKSMGEGYFVLQAVRTVLFSYPRRERPMVLQCGDETVAGGRALMVCNSRPFTFFGTHPFDLCPHATLEGGLDAIFLTSLRIPTVLRIAASAFGSGRHTKFHSVHQLHDVEGFTITSSRPLPFQVDGDYVGEADRFSFEIMPSALSVIA
jgi:diacylglycerol kinase family enzyme